MIKEDYVSFETAKLLKEKGFDIPTEFVWYEHLPSQNAALAKDINKQKLDYFYLDKDTDRNSPFNNGEIPSYIMGGVYSAPTLQMAIKWLVQKHKLYVSTPPSVEGYYWTKKWHSYVMELNKRYPFIRFIATVDSREEAAEAAIKYCLENLI